MGTRMAGCAFNPDFCPLLAGLDPDEQQRVIEADPRVRACMAAANGEAETTPATERQLHAYDICRARAEAQQSSRG